jgi:hypothetical protein
MNMRLSKLLGRAGWGLAAAGTLGMSASALAQSSFFSRNKASNARPVEMSKTVAPVESPARLTEIKVELAWMANPALFPYKLEAHTKGTALEVRGNVPNEAVREAALKTARDESGMRVVDGMKVQSGLYVAPATKPVLALHHDASLALEQSLPLWAHGMTANIWTNGQILLKGNVPSYEHKLIGSRCLTHVIGCSCVINQLTVTNEGVPSDQPATVEVAQESPGKVTILTPEPLKSEPTTPSVVVASHSEQATVVPDKSSPPAAPEPRTISKTPAAPKGETQSGKSQATAAKTPRPMYYQTKWRRMDAVVPPQTETAAKPTSQDAKRVPVARTETAPKLADVNAKATPVRMETAVKPASADTKAMAVREEANQTPRRAESQMVSRQVETVAKPTNTAGNLKPTRLEAYATPVTRPIAPSQPVAAQQGWIITETQAETTTKSPFVPAAQPETGAMPICAETKPIPLQPESKATVPQMEIENLAKPTDADRKWLPARTDTHVVSAPQTKAASPAVVAQQGWILTETSAGTPVKSPYAPAAQPETRPASAETGVMPIRAETKPMPLQPESKATVRQMENLAKPTDADRKWLPARADTHVVSAPQTKAATQPTVAQQGWIITETQSETPIRSPYASPAPPETKPALAPAPAETWMPKPASPLDPSSVKPVRQVAYQSVQTPTPAGVTRQELAELPGEAVTPSRSSAAAATTKPVPVSPPAPATKRSDTDSRGAYVTGGIIMVEEAEAAPEPSAKGMHVALQTRLQQSIAKACSKSLKEVEVTALSEKSILVKVKAHTAQEGEQLSTKIFQMPELAPYKVSLDIPLIP